MHDHDHDGDTTGTATATATGDGDGDDELRPVMADLAHVVHNASNLVLGHVAAIQRGSGDDERLAERAVIIEAALGRITGVVDALRASLDRDYWGPATEQPLDDVLHHAFELAGAEATRRRIRLLAPPADDRCEPGTAIVADGIRASAMLAALLGAEVERLGSNGSIHVRGRDPGPTTIRLELAAEHDDGLALHDEHSRSVWAWIAARIGDQFGATLHQRSPAVDAVELPAAARQAAPAVTPPR